MIVFAVPSVGQRAISATSSLYSRPAISAVTKPIMSYPNPNSVIALHFEQSLRGQFVEAVGETELYRTGMTTMTIEQGVKGEYGLRRFIVLVEAVGETELYRTGMTTMSIEQGVRVNIVHVVFMLSTRVLNVCEG